MIYDGPYAALENTELDDIANKNKIMYLNGDGNLEWRAFDDVSIAELEKYSTVANFPSTGSTSKLYLSEISGEFYRWSGSVYVRTDANGARKNESNTFTQTNTFNTTINTNGIINTGNISSAIANINTVNSTTIDTINIKTDFLKGSDNITSASIVNGDLTLQNWMNANQKNIYNLNEIRCDIVKNQSNNKIFIDTLNDTANIDTINSTTLNLTTVNSSNINNTGVIEVNEIRADNGSATDASYTFKNDQSSGMYLHDIGQPAIAANGTRIMTLKDDSITCQKPIRFTTLGTAALPALTFNDPTFNSGIYSSGNDVLNFSTNGVERLEINNTAVVIGNKVLNTDGTASLPSYSFSSDATSGLYMDSTGNPSISSGGFNVMQVKDVGIYINSSGSGNSRGLYIESHTGSSNAMIGKSQLVNGTKIINTSSAMSNFYYFITPSNAGTGTSGALIVDNIISGVSFRVRDPSASASTNDSDFYWWIIGA
jgi:hypothetical protein